MKRQQFLGLCAALGGSTIFAPVWAQQRYPQKAILLVAPYLAAGNHDVTGRLFAQHLLDVLRKAFVIGRKLLVAIAMPLASGSGAFAQSAWTIRPLKMIAAYQPGELLDKLARSHAQPLR